MELELRGFLKDAKEKLILTYAFVKTILVKVLSDSTMHGMSRVVRTEIILLKLIWLACLLTSASLLIYFSIQSIHDFLDFGVTTKIRKIYQIPTTFPAVSICNKNMFTTDYGIAIIEKTIDYLSFPYIFNLTILTGLPLDQRFKVASKIFRAAGNAVYYLSEDNKKNLGRSIDDFLIECKFDDVACNITQDFVWYFDKQYGNQI